MEGKAMTNKAKQKYLVRKFSGKRKDLSYQRFMKIMTMYFDD